MGLLRNFKIRTKVLIGYLLILIFASIMGFASIVSITGINERNKTTYQSTINPLETLMQVEVAFANVRQTSRGFIIRIISDPTQLEKQEERLKGLLDTMSSSVDTYIQALRDCGAGSDIIDTSLNVKKVYESDFKPMIEQMMNIAKTGDISETVALLDSTNTVSNQIYDEIQAIYTATLGEMSTATEENSKAAEASRLLAIGLLVVSFVLCLILAALITNSIVKPVNRLLGITNDLVRGNLNINRIETSKDEIGVLVDNFYTVIETMKSMVFGMNEMSRRHNEGDTDAKMDASRYEGVYKEMAVGVNEMVFSYMDSIMEIIQVMQEISEGQFNVSIKQYPGKKAVINTAIDNIKHSLKSISKEIHDLAIAAGDGELSRRGDVARYKGDWAEILQLLNALIENVVAPIQEASSVLYEIAQGNLNAKIASDYKGDFTLIKTSVNSMTDSVSSYIGEINDILTNLSNNNLDQEIKRDYVGQFSTIKIAINLIVQKLNSVMGEIRSASEHVTSSSRHISESSMTLAQGTTQQASAIEELAATIDMLNQQTQRNAENAKSVNDLSETSKENVSAVGDEMKQMLTSMNSIKQSSDNISKIIKVIEEIALQTNLLALNAAVEAARAGEHGKGFAVVAEEVRSLASRSQNAAKESSNYIVDSIAKVDDGMQVAVDTASSLDTIIRDFEQMSKIINEIAAASKDQATAIAEVNVGLGQISQVVQANTASSEESASASEELAGQSEILRNMISAFKLKR